MPLRPCLPAATFLALLACSPASSGQAAPAPAPAAQSGMSFSQEFVERTVRDAEEALASGAGVRLVKPVPAVLLTAAQARARRQAYAAQLPEGAGVTAGMDLMADFMFSDTMLGRYLPDEKVLYVVDDVLRHYAPDEHSARDLLFAVVAHELTHAADDQRYNPFPDPVKLFSKFADGDMSGLPSLQVTMSLLEGHATYASELACKSAGVRPLPAPTMQDVRDSQQFDGGGDPLKEGLAGIGNAVARLKLVQYVQGRAFCQQAVSFGGEAFMKEVFTHLPLSADELADFNRFKVRWAAQKDAEEEAAPAPAKADG